MSQLPLPIRLAAGLVAVAVERARKLPRDVSDWPMTAVSQALQVSMRVQQRLTELAIKGDEALAGLREPAESPPWAVFDEDLPPQPSYLRPHAAEPEPGALESLEPQTPALAAVAAATVPEAAEAELEPYDLAADDTTTAEEQSWFEAIDAAYAQPPAAATEPPAEPATAATPAEPAAAATPAAEAATTRAAGPASTETP